VFSWKGVAWVLWVWGSHRLEVAIQLTRPTRLGLSRADTPVSDTIVDYTSKYGIL